MKKALQALPLVAALLTASAAWATPSTVVWSPATTYTQPFLVPHITYDTYFRDSASYPVTTGLTVGVLPFDAVQAELGFDLFYPAKDPLFLNGKVTLVEDKLFANQPGLSVGVANGGVTTATNAAMAYAVLGKTIPGVGVGVNVGAYYGIDEDLWIDADGEKDNVGLLASVTSPAIKIGKPFLDSLAFGADVQTGKNAFGAVGAAATFYFTPSVSLLTGPVFFLEKALQPGASSRMWTLQLDVDIPGIADALKGK